MPVKGLVDGDMSYPFDVNESILWLAELCDLVFVFFDPIGQVAIRKFAKLVLFHDIGNRSQKREHKTKLIWLSEK